MWAAGSGPFALAAGDYLARVTILEGQTNQADLLGLFPATAAEPAHWGPIKRRYR